MARYLPNPEANWGPKPKHGRPLKPKDGAEEGKAAGHVSKKQQNGAKPPVEEQQQPQQQQQQVDETGYDSTLS